MDGQLKAVDLREETEKEMEEKMTRWMRVERNDFMASVICEIE